MKRVKIKRSVLKQAVRQILKQQDFDIMRDRIGSSWKYMSPQLRRKSALKFGRGIGRRSNDATQRQLDALKKYGISHGPNISKKMAGLLIGQYKRRHGIK